MELGSRERLGLGELGGSATGVRKDGGADRRAESV
jgi:hypothetical protein